MADWIAWLWIAGGMALAAALGARWGIARGRRVATPPALDELGRYRLERRLGSGGFGEVFLARHALLRRPCALKRLRPEHCSAAEQERFETEVQSTARLRHPSTVQIYDYGRDADGTFYYTMEYIRGRTLHALVSAWGAMPPGRVVYVLRQACDSLAEAHQLGLVHRDVKPANLMLMHRSGIADWLKVVDFGLVRDLKIPSAVAGAGMTVGTAEFLAPEAIQNPDAVDARTDLYALGATAYYLLTGSLMFAADRTADLLRHQLEVSPEPPSARLGRALPADLERIVMDCLAKDPAERPAGATELRARLDACADADGWDNTMATHWWARHPLSAGDPDDDGEPIGVLPIDFESRA